MPKTIFIIRNVHKSETIASLLAVRVAKRLRQLGHKVTEIKSSILAKDKKQLVEIRKQINTASPERKRELVNQALNILRQSDNRTKDADAIASANPRAWVYDFHASHRPRPLKNWAQRLSDLSKQERFVEDLYHHNKNPVYTITTLAKTIEIMALRKKLWGVSAGRFRNEGSGKSLSDIKGSEKAGLDLKLLEDYLVKAISKDKEHWNPNIQSALDSG